jgi:hypothetical protein
MTGIATSTNTIKTGLCDMPHCKVKYHIRPILSVLTVHTIDRYKTSTYYCHTDERAYRNML